jgi:hypothetical protein
MSRARCYHTAVAVWTIGKSVEFMNSDDIKLLRTNFPVKYRKEPLLYIFQK